ncbi:AbrB/MazE/SpoVT family DNA-binding domain-containing protein [Nitrospirillum viridazoti]|uniref:PbsX family transcriptional regulator n=1 Tax=Nitrospirillum viridazoti CBAmc TaxID=1441467 RepID=A0A248JRY3_9PROT|nr:AbrB/MazE/SpoVT family DNA-binding domain-containing protein [Nitrospirillum amazonense]ASG21493.1 PbsX family transcriptional regulator [Nitrospirillum amazonense CBAmc]TWB42381.1 antitoxin MazE [Nitrospirillum amazonense]
MRVTIRKWGNSASVRIPVAVMEAVGLEVDATVDIREEGNRIVIEPVRKDDYDLADLIAGITPENRHVEVDYGPSVGKEIP